MDFVLAAFLLLQPVSHVDNPNHYYYANFAVKLMANSWEILDSREFNQYLRDPDSFPLDMNILRTRRDEFRSYPPSGDSMRFPDRPTVNEYLAFNRSYLSYLNYREAETNNPGRIELIEKLKGDTARAYAIFDLVRDSRCEYYYITVRRRALQLLKDEIGEADYYAGKLPPWVPVDAFQPIN